MTQPLLIETPFWKFHSANPEIWDLFVKYTFEVINAGRNYYSARAIVHRIRWHADVETDSKDGFKINNNHSPSYARMFMREFPAYQGFFQVRAPRGFAAGGRGLGFSREHVGRVLGL